MLGAVAAASQGLHCFQIDGMVNAESVCSLLIDLRLGHPGEPICVFLDNVPHHRARMVRELAEGFEINLVYLLQYSPNLNLIERPWRWVKMDCLLNAYRETYAAFKDANWQELSACGWLGVGFLGRFRVRYAEMIARVAGG